MLHFLNTMSYSELWRDGRLACLLWNDRQDACPTSAARDTSPYLRNTALSTGFHKFDYVSCVVRLLRRFTPRKDMAGVVIARAKPVAISMG